LNSAFTDVSFFAASIFARLSNSRAGARAVKIAGILLTVEHDGRVAITRGLIRAEDKKALKALAKSQEVAAGGGAAEPSDESDAGAGLSGALRLNLSAQFTAGLPYSHTQHCTKIICVIPTLHS
jgi:ParB family chromosome partitioning protein